MRWTASYTPNTPETSRSASKAATSAARIRRKRFRTSTSETQKSRAARRQRGFFLRAERMPRTRSAEVSAGERRIALQHVDDRVTHRTVARCRSREDGLEALLD